MIRLSDAAVGGCIDGRGIPPTLVSAWVTPEGEVGARMQPPETATEGLGDNDGGSGITLTHTTILRWIQWYVPEFDKRWSRFTLIPSPDPGGWTRHM
jgi:hypothetical protein